MWKTWVSGFYILCCVSKVIETRLDSLDEKDYEDNYKDQLNIKQCLCVNQRHFGGKWDSRRHSNTSFCKNVVVVAETSYI